MNPWFRKLCSRLFTTAAGVSIGLLIFNLHNGYLGLDAPQLHRAGSWEVTWDTPLVTVHRVSPAEETYRQQLENRVIVELWFEGWRTPIDYDIQRLPWNSAPYLAAKARYAIWHDAHAAYERAPMAAAQNWTRDDRIESLGRISAILAVLPLVWCIVAWRRVRNRFARRMIRWFRWEPAERIGWVHRVRRAAILGTCLTSLLLAFAVAIMWIRSHFTSDIYERTEAVGARPVAAYDSCSAGTFVGGIFIQTTHIPSIFPRGQTTAALMVYSQLLSQNFRNTPQPGRPPQVKWTRPNAAKLQMRMPWYGVQVEPSRPQIPGVVQHSVCIRWWVPFAIFCIPAALWLLTHLRLRQLPATGYCFSCGYNLTGNTSGICPECGDAVPSLVERE